MATSLVDQQRRRTNSFGDQAATLTDPTTQAVSTGVSGVPGAPKPLAAAATAVPPVAPTPGGTPLSSLAAPPAGGGAVFGIYPKPSSRFSTNANDAALRTGVQATGPSSFAPATPLSQLAANPSPAAGAGRGFENPPTAVPASAGAPVLPSEPPVTADQAPAVPPIGATPAGNDIVRTGNSYTGAPGISGPVTINGREPGGGSVDSLSSRASGPGAATPNADAVIAASTRLNQGAGVIDGAGGDARQRFFDEAAMRSASAQSSWSPRRGTQGNEAAVAAAAIPLRQRAQADQTAAEQAGANTRSEMQTTALAARAQQQDARAQESLAIDRQRLGIAAAKAGQGNVPTGYRASATGGLEPIPGGPADPNTPKGKNTLNDTQAKALQFGTRMLTAGQNLDRLSAAGTNQPGLIKRAADAVGLGTAANFTQSPEQQQVEQSQRDFVNATLRRESGAAISEGEFSNARQQYFPQPGDSPQVIEQKRKNRELATQGFLAEVPEQERRVQQVLSAAGQTPGPAAAAGGAAAPSLPGGMSRQVGTSGGKPVYEDAQGNRFIGG